MENVHAPAMCAFTNDIVAWPCDLHLEAHQQLRYEAHIVAREDWHAVDYVRKHEPHNLASQRIRQVVEHLPQQFASARPTGGEPLARVATRKSCRGVRPLLALSVLCSSVLLNQ
jgi:hypothetical protein